MVNTAVIGYGYAGRAFHTYLVGLADGLNLYAVATRDAERREAAREAYPNAHIYQTIDEVIADDAVDLVVLATPHDTHAELSIKAMDAGKHVVTDKIMAMNTAEADAMIAASQRTTSCSASFIIADGIGITTRSEKLSMTGYSERLTSFRLRLCDTDRLAAGAVSKVRAAASFTIGPHTSWNQALQLVTAPVESVYCDVHYNSRWDIDIGNYANLIIQFQNDVRYQIEISNLSKAEKPRWYVVGDLGGLIKYGLDPQEGPMVVGNIDAAQQDPENYAKVWTEAGTKTGNSSLKASRRPGNRIIRTSRMC